MHEVDGPINSPRQTRRNQIKHAEAKRLRHKQARRIRQDKTGKTAQRVNTYPSELAVITVECDGGKVYSLSSLGSKLLSLWDFEFTHFESFRILFFEEAPCFFCQGAGGNPLY